MQDINWVYVVVYTGLLALLAPVLGRYMQRVFQGQGLLAGLENRFYGLAGIQPQAEHTWWQYTLNMLAFNALGLFVLYGILRFQGGGTPQSPGVFRGGAHPGLEHSHQLCHQHQLASL